MSVPNLSLLTLSESAFVLLVPFLLTFTISAFSWTESKEVEDELIAVLCCKQDDAVKEIRTCAGYLSVVTPNKADTNGSLTT